MPPASNGTSAPAANNGTTSLSFPPPSSSSSTTASTAYVKSSIVSAYDLPLREPPLAVRVRVGSSPPVAAAQTGPPIQRHKDRNSFKFDGPDAHLVLRAPSLAALYKETLAVEVCYESRPPFVATYDLKDLTVHEPTWLILTLDEGDDLPSSASNRVSNNSSTTTSGQSDNAGLTVPPTIRLQLTLVGPYRPEISALLGLLGAWFGIVEHADKSGRLALSRLPTPHVDARWFLVPAVPIAAAAIVAAPIALGILTVGLPVFLPLLVLAGIVLAGIGAFLVATWSSTPQGRKQIAGVVGPAYSTLLRASPVQQLVYATGPRPSPVTVARTITPTGMHQKLLWSLAIDAIGSGSYLIPFAGEAFDTAWAPLQTILIMALYDAVAPNLKYVSFLEEILPFTDVIPSATMGWLTEFGVPLVLDKVLGQPPSSSSSSASGGRTRTAPGALVGGIPVVPERTGGSGAAAAQ